MSAAKIRSPSYPSMSLEDAVEAISKIEKTYRTSSVDRGEAAKLIGYSTLSGPAAKALADLASYGLLERAGKGEARVTERAKAILYADSDEDRRENLKAAALEPPLFRALTERFEAVISDGMLPEGGVVRHLERQNFNPRAVRPATRAFLGTVAFLASQGVTDSYDAAPPDGGESPSTGSKGEPATYGGAREGDLIQWESDGDLRFPEPLRVRAIRGEWVYVDGSETGIPMSEVIVERREAEPPAPLPKLPLHVGDQTEVSKEDELKVLHDGERLRITASVGREGIARLKEMLEMYEGFLKASSGENKNE